MRRARRLLGAVAVGGASAVAGPVGVGPATADCITAEASYRLLGGPETWAVDPDTCVTPTPFDDCVTAAPHAGEPGTIEVATKVDLVCPD